MHILFTRPFDDSEELILRFKSLGHIVSNIPVIIIKKKEYLKVNYSSFNGIIFTSSNAIKFLDINSLDKNIISSGGGHNMAAGFTLSKDKLKSFENFIYKDYLI